MPLIKSSCASYGLNVILKQSYQPTMQGAETDATLYFFNIGDKILGSPYRASVWNTTTLEYEDRDFQRIETTWQLNAHVRQKPQATTTQPTAKDVINIARMVMQTREFIETLQSSGLGILRVTDIRNPYFKDDRDQFQASPSFDFTLVHNQSMIRQGKTISSYEYNIKGV